MGPRAPGGHGGGAKELGRVAVKSNVFHLSRLGGYEPNEPLGGSRRQLGIRGKRRSVKKEECAGGEPVHKHSSGP